MLIPYPFFIIFSFRSLKSREWCEFLTRDWNDAKQIARTDGENNKLYRWNFMTCKYELYKNKNKSTALSKF